MYAVVMPNASNQNSVYSKSLKDFPCLLRRALRLSPAGYEGGVNYLA
jgi:hypothetical protein